MSSVSLWQPGRDLDGVAQVLYSCVHAGASVSFILPFSMEESRAYWREKVMPGAWAGTRRVLVARADSGEIAGTVQVDLATPPNQRHRAEVAKLLVHPDFRRRGLGRAMMVEAEQQARAAGRSLITLDTRSDDAGEALYLSMSYVLAGKIPGYARGPIEPGLEGTSFFYKSLAAKAR